MNHGDHGDHGKQLVKSGGLGGLRGRTMLEKAQVERLKWRSRRGLLELDLVFERFWRGEGARLSAAEGKALERLLDLPDNDLLDLVMGKARPPDDGTGALVEKLKAA